MKEIISKNKNIILVILIFLIFLSVLIIQNKYLSLYHDDYGYASLSYVYNVEEVNGTQYDFGQILEFLKGHYEIWGGRILYFLIEIVILRYGGIVAFRIIQPLIIAAIFFMIYLIIKSKLKEKINDWYIALATVSLYGVFEIMVVRTGIFWITASVLYVFPILFLLLFIYFYDKYTKIEIKKKINKILYIIMCGIFIFLASFSQEQIAIAMLSYIIIHLIYNIIKNKKFNKIDLLMTIISLIGFLILMMAPGNELRKLHPTSIDFYNSPFISRTINSIESIICNNFGIYNKIFSFIFFASAIYCSFITIKQTKKLKILSSISLISTSLIFFVNCIKQEGYFNYLYAVIKNETYKNLAIFFSIIQLALLLYSITVYLWNKKEYLILNLFYCGIISQAAMIVAPYFPLRSTIIFEVISFVLIINIISSIYQKIKIKRQILYIIIPILIVTSFNVIKITRGYMQNININNENDLILRQTSTEIKEGNEINEIYLKQLPNILYSGDQPYTEGNAYIEEWIKQYYDLPENINLIYK